LSEPGGDGGVEAGCLLLVACCWFIAHSSYELRFTNYVLFHFAGQPSSPDGP
jgi:hypothetical protein